MNPCSPQAAFIPQSDQMKKTNKNMKQTMQNFSVAFAAPQVQKQPHMVWDPAVRALVPITGEDRRNMRQNGSKNKGKKKYGRDQSGVSNGRLISPFPRRYTSSHLPRYRRKFEMTEKNRYEKQCSHQI